MTTPISRSRGDLCPGVLRPWPAADGGLVRLRLVGGAVELSQLVALSGVARAYGDGSVLLTKRANLQVRGLPTVPDCEGRAQLDPPLVQAIEATGLLPSRSHELVRNILLSPLSGIGGGRADLRALAAALDVALRAEPRAADLSARFLFVLDDGRGDVLHRPADLAAVALDETTGQVRVGPDTWTDPVPLSQVVPLLRDLALAFVSARGAGPDAPWHVHELGTPLVASTSAADARVPRPSRPPAYGVVPGTGAEHRAVTDGVLTPDAVDALLEEFGAHRRLVVTPWRSMVITAE